MIAYFGPYKNYFGPYQLAEKLLFWMDKEDDRVHKFGEFLCGKNDDSFIRRFLDWVDSKKDRTIYLKINKWDSWSADHTLSLIVVPLLKQLKEYKHSYSLVDDEDVPEKFKVSNVKSNETCQLSLFPEKDKAVDQTIDEINEMKWNWVLDEIIWAHSQVIDYDSDSKFFDHSKVDKNAPLMDQVSKVKIDKEGLEAHHDRISNGLRLFGKYYQSLWD